MVDKKVDSARALVAEGWRISLVSRCLRVSRAQLHVMARRSKNWQERRRKRKPDDTEALDRIYTVIRPGPQWGITALPIVTMRYRLQVRSARHGRRKKTGIFCMKNDKK